MIRSLTVPTCVALLVVTAGCQSDVGMEPVSEGTAAVVYDFTNPAAGSRHACVKVTNTSGGNSSIHCWGADLLGQQGNGGGIPGPNQLTPGPVSSSSTFDRLAAGEDFQCALPAGGGTPKCWGENSKGQLGTGNTTNSAVPVSVQMPNGVSFVSIAAGGEHACGLTSSGIGYCWGANGSGQLGDNTTSNRHTPVQIFGGVLWSTISVGGEFTCGVQLNSQKGYCWGNDDDGQIGTDHVPQIYPNLQLNGNFLWKTVKAGKATACGIRTNDQVYCWGSDSRSQNGWTAELYLPGDLAKPHRIDGDADANWSGVDVGDEHACATLLPDHKLYCWGRGSEGQTGFTDFLDRYVATPVPGNIKVTNVALGGRFTVVRKATGEILTWGSNGNGQLGDGGLVTRPTPLQILP